MAHYCNYCGAVCEDNQTHCPQCGGVQQQQQVNPQTIQNTPQLPMNWFKFVIWFQLFANCVLNLITAISAITGAQYLGEAESVYAYVQGLKAVDIFYGVVLIGLAVFAIIVRTRLKNYCSNGPTLYYVMLILDVVAAVGYTLITNVVISNSVLGPYYQADYTSFISSIITTVVMLICNITYFNKRKHLFVN